MYKLTINMEHVDNQLISVVHDELAPDRAFSLEEMQACVGGLIEILVPGRAGIPDIDGLPEEIAFVINDEGKLNGSLLNPMASILANTYGMIDPSDLIFGDVLIAHDAGEDLLPLTEEETTLLMGEIALQQLIFDALAEI